MVNRTVLPYKLDLINASMHQGIAIYAVYALCTTHFTKLILSQKLAQLQYYVLRTNKYPPTHLGNSAFILQLYSIIALLFLTLDSLTLEAVS